MQLLVNLILCIWHLGFQNGWRYWKINKYFSSRTKEYQEFLNDTRKIATLTLDNDLMKWTTICQQHLDGQNNQ
jgi:hypothetical protein